MWVSLGAELGAQGAGPGAQAYCAAVVDEARQVAALGGVNDGVMVDAEEVAAANALLCVTLLPHVGHHLGGRGDSEGPALRYG